MITEMKKIPVTEQSVPFMTATKSCDFEKYGYVEDEYFQTGTANIYAEDARGNLIVTTPDAPYTTRLFVRRPADVSKFSGNVIVEIVNSTANFDIDRDWMFIWKKVMRDGDIYIGITSKGHVVDALKKFDPERYAPINWANPTPDREAPDFHGATFVFDFLPQYEMGLFWDMFVDLAKILRQDSQLNPIREYGTNWLYAAAWSQSGSYVARIVHSFAYLPENCADGPLFDGYYMAGTGAMDKALNSYDAPAGFAFSGSGASILVTKEPMLAINTESEARRMNWHGDADEPGYKFRTWQIPCSSHDTKYSMIDYYAPLADQLQKCGIVMDWEGVPENGVPMDTPYEPIFAAGLAALIRWVRDGIPAPHAPKLLTEVSEEPVDFTGDHVGYLKDAFGNAMGGIRYATADCPTARYQSWTDHADGKGVQMMFGTAKPCSVAMLKELYGDLAHYRKLVEKSTDRAVAQGFVLPEDRDEMIEQVVAVAKSRGLE